MGSRIELHRITDSLKVGDEVVFKEFPPNTKAFKVQGVSWKSIGSNHVVDRVLVEGVWEMGADLRKVVQVQGEEVGVVERMQCSCTPESTPDPECLVHGPMMGKPYGSTNEKEQ